MGFYEDMNKRSKEDKRKRAQQRGGFEDEGSMYSGKSTGGNAPRGRGGAPYGQRSPEGNAYGRPGGERSGGNRPARPYAQRPQEGRQGEGRSYGHPDGERSSGNRPARPYAQRPQEGRQGEGRSYGHPDGERSSENRPARPYAQRPQDGRPSGERPYDRQGGERSGGNRPARPYAQRPQEGRQGGERPMHAPFPGQGGGFRKQSGNFRFAKDAGQRYSDRGAGFRPRPYGEQQEARRQSAPEAHARPYAPRGGQPGADAYRYSAPAAYDSPANSEAADIVPHENLLSGRNPIREALKSGRDIEKLLVARGELSGSAREIVQMAKENHIPVQEVDRSRLDAITRNHQGMLAFASAYQYHTVEDMLALAKERGEAPFLVLLDGITDPHNLGAIIRTAECAGAHGVIVHERRAVGLTPAAVKASEGAVEYIPVARVTNLTNTLSELKAQNIWAFAADMEGEDYAKTDFSGPLALVIGAEGEGVSRRVLLNCDKRVALPIRGKLDSLNASVAAGILLYAAMRAR